MFLKGDEFLSFLLLFRGGVPLRLDGEYIGGFESVGRVEGTRFNYVHVVIILVGYIGIIDFF